MNKNVIETVMGAVVLTIAGGFLYTAYQGRSIGEVKDGYVVKAAFDDVSGIGIGSDVRVGGVKVGVVDSMALDSKTYRAELAMRINGQTHLPQDSTAAIVGDGLLGSKFVALEPGAEEGMLKEGGAIEFTQSSVSLEQLIGKFMFSGGGVDKEGEGKTEEEESIGTEEDTSAASPSDLVPSLDEPPAEETVVTEPEEAAPAAPAAPGVEPEENFLSVP